MRARWRAISADTSPATRPSSARTCRAPPASPPPTGPIRSRPKDGTVILATYNALLPEPLYGNPGGALRPLKFELSAASAKQQNICATWHTSPIKTIEQAKTRELTVAATGATGNSASMPRILNARARHEVQGHRRLRHDRAAARGRTRRGGRHLRPVVVDAEGLESRLDCRTTASMSWCRPARSAQADLPKVPLLVDLVDRRRRQAR